MCAVDDLEYFYKCCTRHGVLVCVLYKTWSTCMCAVDDLDYLYVCAVDDLEYLYVCCR